MLFCVVFIRLNLKSEHVNNSGVMCFLKSYREYLSVSDNVLRLWFLKTEQISNLMDSFTKDWINKQYSLSKRSLLANNRQAVGMKVTSAI